MITTRFLFIQHPKTILNNLWGLAVPKIKRKFLADRWNQKPTTSAPIHGDPAQWCAGGRGQFLGRKKRRDGERNQVTEANLAGTQLFIKTLTGSDSWALSKRFWNICISTYDLYDNHPSQTREAKNARLRQRTQYRLLHNRFRRVDALSVNECHSEDHQQTMSAAQAHVRHVHKNNKNHKRIS